MSAVLHILTAAPGTGKTSVLAALDAAFTVAPEPAREMLAELRQLGAVASRDRVGEMGPDAFVALLLDRSIANYRAHDTAGDPVMFDRAIPDCCVRRPSGGPS